LVLPLARIIKLETYRETLLLPYLLQLQSKRKLTIIWQSLPLVNSLLQPVTDDEDRTKKQSDYGWHLFPQLDLIAREINVRTKRNNFCKFNNLIK
jgi:hypothetical protein